MANAAIEWAKDNPLLAGGAALAVVVIVMLATGGGSEEGDPGASGMGAAGVQAYYAAVANQAQAGAAIQTTQIRSNAETNRALIAASYGLEAVKVQQQTERERIQVGGRVAETVALSRERIDYATLQHEFEDANLRGRIAMAALGTKRLDAAQRGAILQAAITGQSVPVQYKPINPGNSAAAIIGAGADAVGAVADVFKFI